MKSHWYVFVCFLVGMGVGFLNNSGSPEDCVKPVCMMRAMESPLKQEEVEEEPYEVAEIISYKETMPRYYSSTCEALADKQEKKKCAEKEMLSFLYQNLRYPQLARDASMEGIVVISFVITKEGQLDSPKIIRDIGGGAGDEALRVVMMMKNWVPGSFMEKPVDVHYNLPIRIKLQD
ncbi:MAG: energy transducer TonB [Bacteroidota bacterium]